ncbi:MAG: hypothetical protein WA160_06790 [Pseudobdellovibrio sp.]
MSFTQKEVIQQIFNWQSQQDEEMDELKRLTNRFAENERSKKAKDIAFNERLEGLRNQFSQFFSAKTQEGQS